MGEKNFSIYILVPIR